MARAVWRGWRDHARSVVPGPGAPADADHAGAVPQRRTERRLLAVHPASRRRALGVRTDSEAGRRPGRVAAEPAGPRSRPAARCQSLTPKLSRDQHALDLGGPLADLVDLHVAPVAGDRVFLDETVATVDLDRLVRGPLGGLGRVQLGHRGQPLDLASRPPAVLVL